MSNSKGKGSVEKFWDWYQKELKTNPIRTRALTSGILSFAGNVVAQKVVQRRPLDIIRTIKFALWGMVGAPIFYNWYMLLDRSFKGKKGNNVVLTKLLMDQLLFAPLANCLFYFFMATLDGNPLSAKKTISEQLWPTMKSSWKLWPAAQLINFAVVPIHLRSLYGNMVAFVWNIMLTVLSQRNAVKAIANK